MIPQEEARSAAKALLVEFENFGTALDPGAPRKLRDFIKLLPRFADELRAVIAATGQTPETTVDALERTTFILGEHTIGPAANGGAECECGGWSGPWSGHEPERHQARMLAAGSPVPTEPRVIERPDFVMPYTDEEWAEATAVPTEPPACPACKHPVSAHAGRWCRIPTGAVNRHGARLICCCEASDAAVPVEGVETNDH